MLSGSVDPLENCSEIIFTKYNNAPKRFLAREDFFQTLLSEVFQSCE